MPLLDPTLDIVFKLLLTWLVEPLVPTLDRFHSTFELRERHTHTRLSDQLAIHLLQLTHLRPSTTTGYTGHTVSVERWARFLLAKDHATLERLASEHPIMTLAKQTLEQLSDDPEARRLARYREDEVKLHKLDLLATRIEGEARGKVEGRVEGRVEGEARLLLKLLALRFGSLPDQLRARVQSASLEQLDEWGERVLTAATLDEVFSA